MCIHSAMNECKTQNQSEIDNFFTLRNLEFSFVNVWTDKSIYEWINKWIKDSEIYDPFIWLSSYLKKKFPICKWNLSDSIPFSKK